MLYLNKQAFPFVPLALGLLMCLGCGEKKVAADPELSEQVEERQLVWSDEFEGSGLPDTSKWNYDLGNGDWGWGNNEQEFYTDRPKNARRENGVLIIEAHKEPMGEQAYTSARLVTRDRASWDHGRLEVRARLPGGRGTWSAIWMLGANIGEVGWPLCGEIDIMEHVGYAPDSLFGTVHTGAFNHMKGTQVGSNTIRKNLTTTFHTYFLDWTSDKMDFGVNEEVFFTFEKVANATAAEWPFDQPQYLLLNLAVGGNLGGKFGVDDSIWPQRMEVDWVRVYQ